MIHENRDLAEKVEQAAELFEALRKAQGMQLSLDGLIKNIGQGVKHEGLTTGSELGDLFAAHGCVNRKTQNAANQFFEKAAAHIGHVAIRVESQLEQIKFADDRGNLWQSIQFGYITVPKIRIPPNDRKEFGYEWYFDLGISNLVSVEINNGAAEEQKPTHHPFLETHLSPEEAARAITNDCVYKTSNHGNQELWSRILITPAEINKWIAGHNKAKYLRRMYKMACESLISEMKVALIEVTPMTGN